MSTPPNGSAWIKRILQDFYRDLNHRSPYFDADMNKFDGDIADVDVGKHRQKVWETAGTKYLNLKFHESSEGNVVIEFELID